MLFFFKWYSFKILNDLNVLGNKNQVCCYLPINEELQCNKIFSKKQFFSINQNKKRFQNSVLNALQGLISSQSLCFSGLRPSMQSGLSETGEQMPPSVLGRSVNPISTGGRLCPPHHYTPFRIFRSSYGPVGDWFTIPCPGYKGLFCRLSQAKGGH